MNEVIIFDFDGVIADSVEVKTIAFAEMFKGYGEEVVSNVIEHHHLNGGISRYVKLKYYYNEFLKIYISEEELENLANQFSNLVCKRVIESDYIPGALEFLQRNFKKYRCFIATGTPMNEIYKILEEKKISHFFEAVYGSPMTKDFIINDIVEKNRLDKDKIVFVGDAISDFFAAEKTGIKFIGVINKNTRFPQGINLINSLHELEFALRS